MIASTIIAKAQSFKYGDVSAEELSMTSYNKDTSAHAVVLNEYGDAYLIYSPYIQVEFNYHVRIKILDSKGFDSGNIEVPLYVGAREDEKLRDIQGFTIIKNADGTTTKTELNTKEIFTVKKNDHWNLVRFAMPALKPGCVVEYKYVLRSPFIQEFRSWDFQSNIPKKWSSYQVTIPRTLNYKFILRGKLQPLDGKDYKAYGAGSCVSIGGVPVNCLRKLFAMRDVPAFVEEDYMTAAKNFRSAVYFELDDDVRLTKTGRLKMDKDWSDIEDKLWKEESFGTQLKKKFLKNVSGQIATLDKKTQAMQLYRYVQKNMRWNNFVSIYTRDGINKAFEARGGTCADINLGLIAALRTAGINAEPVILSTRDNGVVNKNYPLLTDYNYVIAKVNIDTASYLLDATDPTLPFGMLPMRCLNGDGRALPEGKSSYWVDLNSQRRVKQDVYDLTFTETGKLKGEYTRYSRGFEAYDRRAQIRQYSTFDEFVEERYSSSPRLNIGSATVENLDSLEMPLTEKYNVEYNLVDSGQHQKIAFNPFLFDRKTINPFRLKERSYPVDMGTSTIDILSLSISFPSNYTIEYLPEVKSLALPDNGGKFVINSAVIDNRLVFSYMLQLNKPVYDADEYQQLKELFNRIINMQRADVVIKKTDR